MDDFAAPRLWCSVYCETQPERLAAVEARGAAAERAAVVAWLRGGARTHRGFGIRLIADELEKYADSIERGEHCRGEER
jgi:hypothetical protein